MAAARALHYPYTPGAQATGDADLWVLVPTAGLVALGVAMGYSASIPAAAIEGGSVLSYLSKELAFVVVGVAGLVGAARVRMEWLGRHCRLLLAITTALLVGVLFTPERNGAHAWYGFPGTSLSFQPSEMAKLVLVLALARLLVRFPSGLPDWRSALEPFATLFVVVGLVAVEPDMGTAAVTMTAMLVFLHIAGAKLRHLAAAVGVALIPAAVMVWHHPYQLRRILDFFRHAEVELAGGYQTSRSLIALGSGGLTGRGYCVSIEKFFYLPAATTDSILAVVGEELGMLGTWAVVGLLAALVWRGMSIAGRSPDRFSGLVAAGVSSLIGVQALLNIAVVTACLPATGVPLPFVSYGGSSLLFSMVGVGLVLNASRRMVRAPRAEESP